MVVAGLPRGPVTKCGVVRKAMAAPRVHVVAFATHSEGMYESMMEDARLHGMHIEVLGLGTTWESFFGKLRAVLDFTSDRARVGQDDLVVVIDAFDTRINGNVDDIRAGWADAGRPDILFSRDVASLAGLPLPTVLSDYLRGRVFGGPLNAGMYMGIAGPLAKLQGDALAFEAQCKKDDQCAFNALADPHAIAVDDSELVFKNVERVDRGRPASELAAPAVFYGYPATLTVARVMRATGEYAPFFIPEIVATVALLAAAVYMWRRRGKRVKAGPSR